MEGFVKRDEIKWEFAGTHRERLEALRAGKIKAVSLQEPWISVAERQGCRVLIESHSTRSEAAGEELDGPTLAKMFRAQARAAAEKAISLDSSLAEPHASLAYISFYFDWNWTAAEAEFKKAIALNPNYATAHDYYCYFLTAMQRPNEARAQIERALQLDPLSLPINSDVGFQMVYSYQYDAAIEQLKKTLQMNPKFPLAHLWLGRAYQAKGMFDQAMVEYQATDSALPDWPVIAKACRHCGRSALSVALRRRGAVRLRQKVDRRSTHCRKCGN